MRAFLCKPTHYDKIDQWKIHTDKHWQMEGRTSKSESCARSDLYNRNWYHWYKGKVFKIQKWAICVGKRMVVCLGQSLSLPLSLLHCEVFRKINGISWLRLLRWGEGGGREWIQMGVDRLKGENKAKCKFGWAYPCPHIKRPKKDIFSLFIQ